MRTDAEGERMARERRRIVGYDDYDDGVLRKHRKKKGGCLKTLIITLCVVVGLFAVIVVAGLIIGDNMLKSNFGFSVFDVFGAVGDFGRYDKDKIVTNGYDADDVNGFYEAANDMLYFKSGDGEAVINSEYVKELVGEAGTSDVDGIMTSLLGLLSSENFDSDKLGSYVGWKADVEHSSTLTTVTDRQFAAFFDDLVFGSGMIGNMGFLGDVFGEADIGDMLSLEQMIIEKRAESERGADSDDVYLTMTVRIDMHKAFDAYVGNLGDSPIAAFGWLIKWFLPAETYLTATVDMSDKSYGIDLEINSLSDETCPMTAKEEVISKYDTDGDGTVTRLERILIIIESFSGVDIRSTVNESSDEFLGYLCKSDDNEGFCFADAVDLDSVTSSAEGNSLTIDMFGMLTDVLNGQTGANASPEDIIVLMQALVCSDSDAAYAGDIAHRSDLYYDPMQADLDRALAECGFASLSDVNTLEKYERLASAYGAISYRVNGAAMGDGYVNIYGDEFMSALEKTYCLDLNKYDDEGNPTGERYTFSETAALFGISGGGTSDIKLTELFDGAKLAEAAKPESEVRKLEITDRMLGAIITELLPGLVGESFSSYNIGLRTLKIAADSSGDITHTIVTVVVTLDFGGMISGDIAEMLGRVLPDEVAVGLSVDMTPGLTKEERIPAFIANYNDISSGGDANVLNGLTSRELLDALKRILPSVDVDGLVSSVADALSDVTDNMFETLPGFRFVPSLGDSYGYAELPDIFDIAVEFLGLDEGDDAMSAEELRGVVNYIVNFDGISSSVENADVTSFLKQVQQNYYIANRVGGVATALTSFDELFNTLDGNFSTSLLRLSKAETYDYSDGAARFMGMLYDSRNADELTVGLDENALLGIMLDKIDDTGFEAVNRFARLIGAHVTENGISFDLEIIMSEMLNEEYLKMLGCDAVYAEISIRLKGEGAVVDGEYYATEIKLNGEGAGDENYAVLMKLLGHFGAESFDLDAVALDVGRAAYDGLSKLETAGINYTLDASGGRIVFPSFYEYMIDMLGIDDVYTAEDMKAAVQGINARVSGADADDYYIGDANANNYATEEIVLNPVAADCAYPGDIKIEGLNASMTDAKFGRFIIDVNVAPATLGHLAQFVGVPSGANKGNASAMQAMLDRFAPDAFASEKARVVFTFDTDMRDLFSSDGASAELSGLLPERAYMTLVFAYDENSASPLAFEDFMINGMTKKVRDLLISEICGVDIDGLLGNGGQIAAHVNDASKLVSDYDFSIGAYDGDDGFSTITLPSDQVLDKIQLPI